MSTTESTIATGPAPTGSDESSETVLRKSVLVHAPLKHVFDVFTAKFDSWWPRTHHIGKVEPYTTILEPRVGGRWFERGADGSECDWGRVLEYSPPARVTVSWHLGSDYTFDPDPAKASRVEVSFHDQGNGTTRVELVHSLLDRHGIGWEKVRVSVGSPGGWPGIMDGFAATVSAAWRAASS
jgi:uncharacterized protein YndB with AHSA1/START domain